MCWILLIFSRWTTAKDEDKRNAAKEIVKRLELRLWLLKRDHLNEMEKNWRQKFAEMMQSWDACCAFARGKDK